PRPSHPYPVEGRAPPARSPPAWPRPPRAWAARSRAGRYWDSQDSVLLVIPASQPPGREVARPASGRVGDVAQKEMHVSRQPHIRLSPQQRHERAMAGAAENAVGPGVASRPFDAAQQRQPDVRALRRKYDVRNRRYASTAQSGIAHHLGAAQSDHADEEPPVPRGGEPEQLAVQHRATIVP